MILGEERERQKFAGGRGKKIFELCQIAVEKYTRHVVILRMEGEEGEGHLRHGTAQTLALMQVLHRNTRTGLVRVCDGVLFVVRG